MSGPLSSPISLIAIVAALLISGIAIDPQANAARADDCLTAPKSPAPDGSHWYYHMDWAKQRKCWYLRAQHPPAAAQAKSDAAQATHTVAVEKAATVSVGAPISIRPGDSALPLPHIKMVAVEPQPAFMSSQTRDELVQQSAQTGNIGRSIPEPAASQQGAPPQPGAQPGPTPAVGMVWPEPPAVAVIKAQVPITVLSDADNDPVEPIGDSGDTDNTHPAAAPASNVAAITPAAEMAASITEAPVEIFPILALGLAVAGILFRVVTRIVAARRTVIDAPKPDWVGEQHQHKWRDDQQQHRSLNERDRPVDEQEKFIDDLRRSLAPTESDYMPRRPFQGDNRRSENAHRKDRGFLTDDEINERKNILDQLRRDLDRLLRAPKAA